MRSRSDACVSAPPPSRPSPSMTSSLSAIVPCALANSSVAMAKACAIAASATSESARAMARGGCVPSISRTPSANRSSPVTRRIASSRASTSLRCAPDAMREAVASRSGSGSDGCRSTSTSSRSGCTPSSSARVGARGQRRDQPRQHGGPRHAKPQQRDDRARLFEHPLPADQRPARIVAFTQRLHEIGQKAVERRDRLRTTQRSIAAIAPPLYPGGQRFRIVVTEAGEQLPALARGKLIRNGG